MDARTVEDIYPLSPMQQGMLFHSLYAGETGVYFEQTGWTLRGPLDRAAFARAWQQVVDRHSALRTSFVWEELDEPVQVVHRQAAVPFTFEDWRGLPPAEQTARLEAFMAADRAQGFDLLAAPLMRLALLQLDDQTHHFIWSHHHLLLDGWSQPVLFGEVFALYEAALRGRTPRLPSPRPYRDYIAWLQEQDRSQAEAYWRRTLAGFVAPTQLMPPLSAQPLPAAPVATEQEATPGDYLIYSDALDAATTAALQTLARQHRLTLNTVVQGAWALLLSRYSRETDVVFGATVSGRPADLPGAEGMVGLFINTLPVRIQVRPEMPALAWLQEVQRQQAEGRQFEHSHLVEVQGWSDVPRGLPLFENILVFENYPVDEAIGQQAQEERLRIESHRAFTRTNYPLTVALSPGKQLGIELAHEVARYDSETIRRMAGHLKTVLAGIAAAPDRPLAQIPWLTDAERQQILGEWTATAQPFPDNTCIHHLFEQFIDCVPDNVALVYDADPLDDAHEQLTYAELNQRANRLAHLLRKHGVGPEVLVGICTERSTDMIVALLSVLKAGGAYLPLDPDYPPDRLAYILEDAQVALLLTQSSLQDRLAAAEVKHLHLDELGEALAAESDANPVDVGVGPANLAYVIYTSGSTGRPKGTLLHHRGICNMARAFASSLKTDYRDRVLQFASFSFDASVCETFLALTTGASLYLTARETLLSIPSLVALLQRHAITTTTMPPSLLRLLPAEQLPALKTVGSVGEACTPEIVAQWAPGRHFLNGYGPTEATVGVAWGIITGLPEDAHNVPIGRPIANARLYILDDHMQPAPIGVPGELYIGGVGVARGYLNRPELTAERFVPEPFAGETRRQGDKETGENVLPLSPSPHLPLTGARLYRTGDLVRWLPDGQIEFLGRLDDQVKVRGFRIELGEIEAALNALPELVQSAVLAREDRPGNKHLVAYLAPQPGAQVTPANLRAALSRDLPDYMVPSYFVIMAEGLPLLPSGKINRKALPAPEADSRGGFETSPYIAPRTPVENGLAQIWAEVLGVARVGVHDSFFELGGHSLVATQIVSRARQVFGVDLPLRDLFDVPTVAGLAARVEALLRASAEAGAGFEPALTPALAPVPRAGDLLLSFAQQRLWFLDQLEPGSLFNNIPTAIRLSGALDITALSRALDEIVRRHEVLRTTFSTAGGKPIQVIHPAAGVPLPVDDLSDLPADAQEDALRRHVQAEASRPFDLDAGPLLRARLLKLAEQEHVAIVVMHHIISDGWSMGVFVREVSVLYAAFCEGVGVGAVGAGLKPAPTPAPTILSELPLQYADFAAWQRAWLAGPVQEQQLAYWRRQLAGSATMLELPTDRPRPAIQTSNGSTVSFALGAELSAALHQLSRDEGATLFMTLLSAFQALLHRYTGQEDINVGTPIAGRNRPEIEGLIGFFVNTLVLRARPHGALPFSELVAQTREAALGAYAHQDLPFELLVEALQPQRDLSHTPLFQVMFVLDPPAPHFTELPGLSLRAVDAHSGAASFDITLSLADGPQGLGGYIEYNTDLFDAGTIERMVGHYKTLLGAIVEDPEQPLAEMPLLTDAERQQLLDDWNRTELATPTDRHAHELVEAWAAAQPDAPAVIFEDQTLSYSELNRRANQLAHHLRGLGVGPETLVGLLTDRSLETIIGILGIMKAGGAYLPLDPAYPTDRIAFMIEDSGIAVLLTQARVLEAGKWQMADGGWRMADGRTVWQGTLVQLDADWPEIARQPTSNIPDSRFQIPDTLAYVIYTSGSTGRPKGAMLHHRGLCNLAEVQRQAFDIVPGSRVLQFAPLSFDASVWETFMALANGGTLVLARQEVLASGPDLLRLLRDQRVTTVTLPPSVLAVLEPRELPHLAVVVAAGEKCTAAIVRKWSAEGRRFFDAYGPTETTVCASMALCDPSDPRDPTIGRPIGNCQLYIVDAHMRPAPIGVPGELLIGGVNVGRGYWRRPELTAERFAPDPFAGETRRQGDKVTGENAPPLSPSPHLPLPAARLYRTGDLARYRADGNIEFLGRIDYQVKVRGFRIELGEIESALRQQSGVLDTVVVAWRPAGAASNDADQRLVAYIVPEGPEVAPSAADLRAALRQLLPEYMVPSYFVTLEHFPLSPSGKIDRRALPAPEGGREAVETEYVAPRTATETQLAAICADLLRVAQVGVYDNFFDLGGHSLLATQLISRVRETFTIELPLRTLFEHPTVAELAAEVDAAATRAAAPQAPAITAISRDARRMKRSDLGQK